MEPGVVYLKQGDLTVLLKEEHDAKTPHNEPLVVFHQLNGSSLYVRGVANVLANAFPFCAVHDEESRRTCSGQQFLGKCVPRSLANIAIVGLVAQRDKSGSNTTDDTDDMRAKWFCDALEDMRRVYPNQRVFYCPFMIGCVNAKGNWGLYYAMLKKFAEDAKISIVLVQLAENK